MSWGKTEKEEFRTRGRADGGLIERIINRFYTDIAATWTIDRIMIDGGAHQGLHSLRMARLPRVSRVVSVEANQKTFKKFTAIVERERLTDKIEANFAALQNDQKREQVQFTTSDSHPGRSGINPILRDTNNPTSTNGTTFNEPVLVPATTIDKLAGGRAVGFIKLDLEGGEYHAFMGGLETLRRSQPPCAFENGIRSPALNGYAAEQFVSTIASVGLSLVTVFGEPMTRENAADFWYAFAIPTARSDAYLKLLQSAVESQL